jgi:murein DD-endopeptidase MepM/ murein hydrolase activator NlpD
MNRMLSNAMSRTRLRVVAAGCLVAAVSIVQVVAAAGPPEPTIEPLLRVVDLNLGESAEVELHDGAKVRVKLLDLEETRDSLRQAVRQARVQVEVDGRRVWLGSANYHLPQTVGRVQIDCPITKGLYTNANRDAWGLEKDARLRLWPADSPLVRPGTFVYPIRQRWFASSTQMANEPCHVDSADNPKAQRVYYHWGLDFGGVEEMTEVVAATDGLVVSAGKEVLDGYEGTPVSPRYDVVYVLDPRGWYYRYSHLFSFDEAIRPGAAVKAGQPLGLLGKEGGSGGWSHLHFDISCRQPSGKWGCQEAYALVWEAYRRQYDPKLIAVARPHHLAAAGEKVTLDASRSWSAAGKIVQYRWTFTDGTTAEGATIERTYPRAGYFSEVVQVTDAEGRVDHDFAIVVVIDPQLEGMTPAIHVVHHPTLGIQPGDEVTLKARSFANTHGEETWDFGDGSPRRTTRSDGNVRALAPDGYAMTTHRYERAGRYLVRVERTDALGRPTIGYVQVVVGEE